ncbi:DUF3710 domain-containing protein [Corynebacterium sp. HMSC04H06]|uniref:DUF3710 domain-containing protein n=1 Tax=Corynebacterium sp. HMSC04H06 TaxID=1581050 RepID=UPI0008A1CC43|nr:DUF3710 domain-containing protein [Corynebacterium sp. HMSC04H06]
MALWPFGKKNKDNHAPEAPASEPAAEAAPDNAPIDRLDDVPDTPGDAAVANGFPGAAGISINVAEHDAVGGDTGPFDGDSLNYEVFDFSDFSAGTLDLGSMKIALPKSSQVQVEMGEKGPKMLHIVTTAGRITPVAFAAPRSSGQWESSAKELIQGIENDGLPTRLEEGPWGTEIVGSNDNGEIRIIGVEGPRWMLRVTLAAPKGKSEELARIGRELVARTFVYRGDEPILAGNALRVVMPPALVEQLQKAMQQRQAGNANADNTNAGSAGSAGTAGNGGQDGQDGQRTAADEEREKQLREQMWRLLSNGNSTGTGNAGGNSAGADNGSADGADSQDAGDDNSDR